MSGCELRHRRRVIAARATESKRLHGFPVVALVRARAYCPGKPRDGDRPFPSRSRAADAGDGARPAPAGRRPPPRGELEPFRVWALRVYVFSVLAVPFYFWRTRGGWRWALGGVAVAIGLVAALTLLSMSLEGCSAGGGDVGREARAPRAGDAGAEAVAPPSSRGAPARTGKRCGAVSCRPVRAWCCRRATSSVASGDAAVVAGLVALSRDGTRVPLTRADLVYPGGPASTATARSCRTTSNRLGPRAGWVLEALTFRDFGFSRAPFANAAAPAEDARAAERAERWWERRPAASRASRRSSAPCARRTMRGCPRSWRRSPRSRSTRRRAAPPTASRARPARGRRRGRRGSRARSARRAAVAVPARPASRRRDRPPGARAPARTGRRTSWRRSRARSLPELAFSTDVPGAAQILAPRYALRRRPAWKSSSGA